jgi:hypothetical protein
MTAAFFEWEKSYELPTRKAPSAFWHEKLKSCISYFCAAARRKYKKKTRA